MTDWLLENYKTMLTAKGRIVPVAQVQALRDALSDTEARDTKHLHPSDLAKKDWCGRENYYKIIDTPADSQKLTFTRLNVFAEGHYIHAKWQRWLASVLRETEAPLSDPEHMILGHADGIIDDLDGEAVLEIKSIGVGTIRFENYGLWSQFSDGELDLDTLWRAIKAPFPSHIRQVHIYMHCLGIHTAILLYESKFNQEVKEFQIKFNPEIMQPILDSCKLVMHHLDTKTTPMRPWWADSSEHSTCKRCPYRKTCWKDMDHESIERNDPPATPGTKVLLARSPRGRHSTGTRVLRRSN